MLIELCCNIQKANDLNIRGAEKFAWAIPGWYLKSYYNAPLVPMEELYLNMSHHLGVDWDIYIITKNKGPNKHFAISCKVVRIEEQPIIQLDLQIIFKFRLSQSANSNFIRFTYRSFNYP